MEIILFTIVGILVYLTSDALLQMLEKRRGAPFEHRNVIFFLIFLPIVLITFEVMQYLLATK